MLVLSRRLGEEIVIDGQIRLVVLGVRQGRVRLGISAPDSVSVDRKEIHDLHAASWLQPLSLGLAEPRRFAHPE